MPQQRLLTDSGIRFRRKFLGALKLKEENPNRTLKDGRSNMINSQLRDDTTRFMFIVWANTALDTFQMSSMAVQCYPRLKFG